MKPWQPTNVVKASTIRDGDIFLTWEDRPSEGKRYLYQAQACRCDDCDILSTINGGRVLASSPRYMLDRLPFVHPVVQNKAGERVVRVLIDEIGAYDADGSGEALCSGCAAVRDAKAQGVA